MKPSPVPFVRLLADLTDSNSQVRRQALTGIMRRRKERWLAVPDVLPLLADAEAFVRLKAAEALGQLGDARAVEPLASALSDLDERVRQRAATALGTLGKA